MGITRGDSSELVRLVGRAIQARHPPGHRPLNVLVGGSQTQTQIDLHLLLLKVRNLGGYSKTSGARKWGTVAASLGLPPHSGPSVKLIYLKYLKNLESGGIFAATGSGSGTNAGKHSVEPIAPPSVPEALSFLKRLALDPSDVSLVVSSGNREFQATVERVLSSLRLKEEDHVHERQARRASSAKIRYSLRSFRSPQQQQQQRQQRLEDGQLLSPAGKKVSIPIGPDFQAEVSAAAAGDDGDSALFLGRLVWSPMGKVARIDFSGGVSLEERSREWIKVRVKEQSRKLEVELGSQLFREWGFDRMGENLIESAKWSGEEEAEFAAVVKECQGEKENKLWPELQARFAGRRSRGDLASYLFNVYVPRRRALRNRMRRPGDEPLDSDADEEMVENFGSGAAAADSGIGSGSKALEAIFQNAEACVNRCDVSAPYAGSAPEPKSCVIQCSC